MKSQQNRNIENFCKQFSCKIFYIQIRHCDKYFFYKNYYNKFFIKRKYVIHISVVKFLEQIFIFLYKKVLIFFTKNLV